MAPKNYPLIVGVLIKHIKSFESLYKSFDFSRKQQKYNLSDYLIEILYILKTGIAWRDIRSQINWNSIYKIYIKLNNHHIFETKYIDLLNKYIKKGSNKKLKYVSTDTTFIPNKKGKDYIGYNKFYNRKNGTKLSIIVDVKGVPLNLKCCSGNEHDGTVLLKQLKTWDVVKNGHDAKHKRYFLADPAYDSVKIREKVKSFNYEPLIHQNKRNIKDPSKIKKLNEREKIIYKKRLIVENRFSSLKNNRRISIRYDSKIESFKGFIYLALIKMLC